MFLLVSAWGEVSNETIQNCFVKVGFSTQDKEKTMSDEDDPFKLIEEDLSELPENTTPDDILQFDNEPAW